MGRLRPPIASFYLLITIIIFGVYSCKDDPVTPPQLPPPDAPDYRKINLFIDEVSCSEAWIKITTDSIDLPAQFSISCGSKIESLSLFQKDTLLYFDSLQTGERYEISAIYTIDSIINTKTFFNTLNATSTSFTWEVFEFGSAKIDPSAWYDVTIVNENDIWLAGDVKIMDSLGVDYVPHGAAHWDGTKWTLLTVSYRITPYSNNYWPGELKSIINFGPNAVYAAAAGTLIKWNGKEWEEKIVQLDVNINKIWGADENTIYGAALNGKVYKTVGNNWVELPQLTNLGLQDIYGTPDGKKIWVSGFKNWNGEESILIEYEGDKGKILWQRVGTPGPTEPQFSCTVWATKHKLYFAGGRYMHEKFIDSDELHNSPRLSYWPYCVKGSNYNNIFVTGDMGMIMHFNGESWNRLNLNSYSSPFKRVAAKDNIVVAVGYTYENFPPRGLVYLGKH